MRKFDKEGLETLINKTVFVLDNPEQNATLQKALVQIMNHLCAETDKVLEHALENVFVQPENNVIGEITAALLELDCDGKSLGLFDMGKTSRGLIFLDEDYPQMRETVGDNAASTKIFHGEYENGGKKGKFEYTLAFDKQFLDCHRIIRRMAMHYGLENPIMYSPYSAKAFQILFDNSLAKYKLNFRFAENGLKAQIRRLCWNFRQDIIYNRVYDGKIPFGEMVKYKFIFPRAKQGNFYYVLPCNSRTRIYDVKFTDAGTELAIDQEQQDFLLLEYLPVDRNAAKIRELEKGQFIHTNKISFNAMQNRRIIAAGDIEYAIAPFRSANMASCQLTTAKMETFLRYSAKYRIKQENFFNKIRCQKVEFTSAGIKFLNDYVNYALECLDFFYPEVEWIGVKPCPTSGKITV